MRIPAPALRRNLVAGALAGLCGAFVFAAAHAIVIVPIWTRSASGFGFGALAGIVAGWAYTDLGFDARAIAARSRAGPLAIGATFGALLWLAVVPVTLTDALLRALGVEPRNELVEIGIAITVAITGGALLGRRLMRSWRAAIAGASATVALTIAMVGPVPVGRSLRALTIFLAVLPAAAIAGATLGATSSWLRRVGVIAPRPDPASSG